MSFIESSPGGGTTPRVEDAPPVVRTGADRVERRAGDDVPRDVRIRTHQAMVSFHDQEIREAPRRGKHGMPPEMVDLHRLALKNSVASLVTLGVAEMIPVRPEPAMARQAAVPAFALPELATVAV